MPSGGGSSLDTLSGQQQQTPYLRHRAGGVSEGERKEEEVVLVLAATAGSEHLGLVSSLGHK